MKKSIKLLLLTVLGTWMAGSAWAIEPVDGIYKIGSAQDWAEFCTLHNDGTDQRLNAELTADVTVEGNVMVGINGGGKPYRGVFDGKGHTLTVAYNLNEERVAPFRRINGATIKNLIVRGTINTSSKLASGLVGGLWQNGSLIQNCVSYVVITDTQGGDATHGGICGSFEDVNGANTIENCAFLGEIDASNREGCGGIVGWTNNNNNNNVIKNCLVNAAGFKVKTGSNNDIICRHNANVVNCYYLGNIDGMKNDQGAVAATAAQAASGELCFLLNGSQSATPAWFQTIGTDAMPMPMGTAVVYANGSLNCDGTPKAGVTYSNTAAEPQRDNHDYVDGICSVCHDLQLINGYYQIGCADALIRFAEIVNNGNGNSNAIVLNDIDMTGKGWTPIGQDGKDFNGHFNGQNKRIKNLVVNNPDYENQALFGQVVGGAVIENVIMDVTCSIKGKAHVAGILGRVWGSGAQVKNCVNEASVESAGNQAAGIVATAEKKIFIEGCVNKGSIKGAVTVAGILARIWNDSDNSSVTDCINEGTIEGTGNEVGGIVGAVNKIITIDKCINKATVKGGGSFTGGILGRIYADNVIVKNCGNEAAITGTGANAAGIVGCSGNIVKIHNCYNLGYISGGNESAAICAWMGNGSSELKNCYSTGTVDGLDGSNYLIRKTDITKSNNYQLKDMPGDQGETFVNDDLASGKLAYLLNGSKSTDVAWYQTLEGTDKDAYPMPWGTAVVYKNGDLNCDGSSKGSDSYSNTEGANQDPHQFADGFCSVCDSYDPDFMTASSGYYVITNGTQLRWTAVVSQEAANAGVKVKLDNDIDMDGIAFDGFGSNLSDDNRFKGEIDGQRHKIFNLKMNADRQGVGLVNTATVGAKIKNLTMASSCDIKGTSAVAAFIGAVRGSEGELYIENCGNEGAVTASGANGAGFVGCKFDDNVIPCLTNCYNVGVIHSGNDGGSFSGWMPKAKLINCYSIVSPDEKDGNGMSYGFEKGNQFGRGWSQELTNCYDFGTGDWDNKGDWGSCFKSGAGKIAEVTETEMGRVFAGLFDGEGGNVWRMEYTGWAHPVVYEPETLVVKENRPMRVVAQENVNTVLYRTLVANVWNTFCVPFNITNAELKSTFGDDVQVAVYSETAEGESSTVNFNKMTTPAVTANVPVLLKVSNAGTGVYDFSNRTIAAGEAKVAGTNFDFVGTYEPSMAIADGDYFLSADKLYKSTGTTTIAGTRAYIKAKTANARIVNLNFGDETTTGIANVNVNHNDKVYDLQGRRVNNPTKGMYIVNGKKVIK